MKQLPTFPIGAIEVVIECQQLLAGERTRLTTVAEYSEQRRRYWRMQAARSPHRSRAALPRRQAA